MKKYQKEGQKDSRSDKRPSGKSEGKGSFGKKGRSDSPGRKFTGGREDRNEKSKGSGYQGFSGDGRSEFGKPKRSSSGKFEKRGGDHFKKNLHTGSNSDFAPLKNFGKDTSFKKSGESDSVKNFGKSDYSKRSGKNDSDRDFRTAETEKRFPKSRTDKNYPKRDFPGKDLSEKEFKTVYKGRGRDQKPIFETVKAAEAEKKRAPRQFFNKKSDLETGPMEERPAYNFKKFEKKAEKTGNTEEIRLNKYIANSGVCSRREADSLIENGLITVNGEVIKELGHKVNRGDRIKYNGKNLNPESPVYILLNKPKDFITTTDDPLERKTVMQLVSSAGKERIFPVGRLDRNTTGLLLFTNDGELAEKLAHPSNKIKKIYQVTLDKPLTKKDEEAILEGLTLEDGIAMVDDMQVLSKDRTILGMEIHIGRNRIVRRIFSHLGYDVEALDRVLYAGLSKKDLSRGKYRFLTEKEVINLKYFKS